MMSCPDIRSERLVVSNTPGALQKNWKIPAHFPLCPATYSDEPLATYFAAMYIGDVAVVTPFGQTIIGDTAMTPDGKSILLLGEHGEDAIKPWSLPQITFEDGYFIHESHGMFFFRDGAEKEFTIAQGLPWEGENTFDDCCR